MLFILKKNFPLNFINKLIKNHPDVHLKAFEF